MNSHANPGHAVQDFGTPPGACREICVSAGRKVVMPRAGGGEHGSIGQFEDPRGTWSQFTQTSERLRPPVPGTTSSSPQAQPPQL